MVLILHTEKERGVIAQNEACPLSPRKRELILVAPFDNASVLAKQRV